MNEMTNMSHESMKLLVSYMTVYTTRMSDE